VKYADTVTSSLSPLVHPWDLPPKGDSKRRLGP
jgi:hypothetical protein